MAVDLLSEAGSERAGLTARVVATPEEEGVTFFESAEARAALADVQAAVSSLTNVIGSNDPSGELASGTDVAVAGGSVSPDGRVALVSLQYPVMEDLSRDDLEELKDAVELARGVSHDGIQELLQEMFLHYVDRVPD